MYLKIKDEESYGRRQLYSGKGYHHSLERDALLADIASFNQHRWS